MVNEARETLARANALSRNKNCFLNYHVPAVKTRYI
jgi:hypothetical protein